MSSLAKTIAAEKALNPPVVCCVDRDYTLVIMATFSPWQAKEWTLPWSRLDGWSLSDEGELERMEFLFPHHRIVIVGENLRRMLDDLLAFRIKCLRSLPASHRANLKPGSVFITELEVRVLGDPKGRSSDSLPF
ncbi:MAG TPA: hypothetical protein VGG34_14880 [Opitutaceae bacterium]|jgi:hypothetical protein